VYSIAYSTEDKMVRKMKIIISYHPLGLRYGSRIEYLYDISFEPPAIYVDVLRHNHSWGGTKTKRLTAFSVRLPDGFETPWWLLEDQLGDTIKTEGTKKAIELIFDYLKILLSWVSSECLNFNL